MPPGQPGFLFLSGQSGGVFVLGLVFRGNKGEFLSPSFSKWPSPADESRPACFAVQATKLPVFARS